MNSLTRFVTSEDEETSRPESMGEAAARPARPAIVRATKLVKCMMNFVIEDVVGINNEVNDDDDGGDDGFECLS